MKSSISFDEEYTLWYYQIVFMRENGEHLGYFQPTGENSLCLRSFRSKDEAKKHAIETGLIDKALIEAL